MELDLAHGYAYLLLDLRFFLFNYLEWLFFFLRFGFLSCDAWSKRWRRNKYGRSSIVFARDKARQIQMDCQQGCFQVNRLSVVAAHHLQQTTNVLHLRFKHGRKERIDWLTLRMHYWFNLCQEVTSYLVDDIFDRINLLTNKLIGLAVCTNYSLLSTSLSLVTNLRLISTEQRLELLVFLRQLSTDNCQRVKSMFPELY